ncbi:MAG TPA: hypothetical protein VLD67_15140 [Vicinamibacterales bacterium]|nr:hypothetical protein [Vicinamibacterales bacterium]
MMRRSHLFGVKGSSGSHAGPVILALGLSFAAALAAQRAPKFYPDDPLQREPDTQDASKVQEWEIGLTPDLVLNLFTKPGDLATNVRAQNINTIDEVPDSNWFTNRILARTVSVDEITRGPNTIEGPAPGKWTLLRPKSAGVSPGFTVRDEKGVVWFVTFDPDGYPVAPTAVIMVATKLFWALGYYQVESYLTSIRPENVEIAETATIRAHGKRRPFTRADLDEVFDRAHRSPDGSYRAVAGRGLPGRPVGGFKYYGTRPDDPNDVVPHEHRRELRALQVFGAWTNLVDMKAGNTLDTVVEDNGRSVVRHYLQDVGSTFGTGALAPRDGDEGHEYLYEGGPTAKRLFTLGLYIRPWQTMDYEEHPEIGKFEGDEFDPEQWRPRVPIAALRHVRPDDMFWAARRVMAFTDEQIRAAVSTGGYTDPAAEKLLADVLIKRRDKIGRVYYSKINPLVSFALDESGVLTFENVSVGAGFGDAPKQGYQAVWSRFDNATHEATPIGSPTTSAGERLQAPSDLPRNDGVFVKVSVQAVEPPHPAWAQPVDVYFTRTGGAWKLVGLERLADGAAAPAAPSK